MVGANQKFFRYTLRKIIMSQSAKSTKPTEKCCNIQNLCQDIYRKQILCVFDDVKIMNKYNIPKDVAEIIASYYCIRTKDELDLSWHAARAGIYYHYKRRSDSTMNLLSLQKKAMTRDSVMDIAYMFSDILKAMKNNDIFNDCTYQ